MFGTACTPGAADRDVHGLVRGRLRRLLQLRPLRPRAEGRMSREPATASRARRPRPDRARRARSRPRFKDARITMAHGAGGKATQALVEGLFVPALRLGRAARARRRRLGRRRSRDHDRQLRRQADPVPGRLDRRARRQRDRQRPRGLRGAAARADRSRSCSRRASGRTSSAPRSTRSPRPPSRRGGCGRRRYEGRRAGQCDSMYVTDRGRAARRARAALAALCRPGDRIPSPGPIGEHGTAIMLARGEFELDAAIESDTRSLWPAVDALLDAAGPSLRCLRDATRGGVASVLNELARASASRCVVARRPCRCGRRSRGLRDPRHRPDVRRERGQAGGLRRAGRSRRGARGAARRAGRRARRPRSARYGRSRQGWCWWRPLSAGGG